MMKCDTRTKRGTYLCYIDTICYSVGLNSFFPTTFLHNRHLSHSFIDMDVTPENLRGICPRFRVLIMGRRNAGKTTLLEKMTASEVGAKPVIRDKNGILVVCALFSFM